MTQYGFSALTRIVLVMFALAGASSSLSGAFAQFEPLTLPDTSCAPAVGVGENDIPHAYYTANGLAAYPNDACPNHYSGELGFGVGGVWLFSREGPSMSGGDGVVACYGSTDPPAGPTTGHHGPHNTINVQDDVFGGAVAFSVARDFNRSEDNPFLPSSNNAGDFDCGDGIIEPCDPADPTQYTTLPGCNPLDTSIFVFPTDGFCTGLSSLGPFPPPANPTFIDLIINFGLSLIGLLPPPLGTSTATCEILAANSWTVPGGTTLADFAGADGVVLIIIKNDIRFDTGHFGRGTTGAVWTSDGDVPVGRCTFSPGPDAYLYTCTYVKGSCAWVYRSTYPRPREPIAADLVISKEC